MSPLRSSRALRRSLLPLLLLGALTACDSDSTDPIVPVIEGSYTGTTFTVTPDNASAIDALAGGGTLAINIASGNAVTGSLSLPAAVTGESEDFTANMAGTAVITGSTVRFTQAEDSFVRDLTWAIEGTSLRVVNQQAGAARFTITLQR